jgi:hypothetical protein
MNENENFSPNAASLPVPIPLLTRKQKLTSKSTVVPQKSRKQNCSSRNPLTHSLVFLGIVAIEVGIPQAGTSGKLRRGQRSGPSIPIVCHCRTNTKHISCFLGDLWRLPPDDQCTGQNSRSTTNGFVSLFPVCGGVLHNF